MRTDASISLITWRVNRPSCLVWFLPFLSIVTQLLKQMQGWPTCLLLQYVLLFHLSRDLSASQDCQSYWQKRHSYGWVSTGSVAVSPFSCPGLTICTSSSFFLGQLHWWLLKSQALLGLLHAKREPYLSNIPRSSPIILFFLKVCSIECLQFFF